MWLQYHLVLAKWKFSKHENYRKGTQLPKLLGDTGLLVHVLFAISLFLFSKSLLTKAQRSNRIRKSNRDELNLIGLTRLAVTDNATLSGSTAKTNKHCHNDPRTSPQTNSHRNKYVWEIVISKKFMHLALGLVWN